jgi:hypothetical protein
MNHQPVTGSLVFSSIVLRSEFLIHMAQKKIMVQKTMVIKFSLFDDTFFSLTLLREICPISPLKRIFSRKKLTIIFYVSFIGVYVMPSTEMENCLFLFFLTI